MSVDIGLLDFRLKSFRVGVEVSRKDIKLCEDGEDLIIYLLGVKKSYVILTEDEYQCFRNVPGAVITTVQFFNQGLPISIEYCQAERNKANPSFKQSRKLENCLVKNRYHGQCMPMLRFGYFTRCFPIADKPVIEHVIDKLFNLTERLRQTARVSAVLNRYVLPVSDDDQIETPGTFSTRSRKLVLPVKIILPSFW
ncbi:uncharacterized protein LOC129748911 [Uranotaenia lowii]|uniref:uncharacterized protein LOC129748911 n=1 Tax=Uranotaenia lowii TaxID=190385 RepID=UPI00247A372F|nr:uncharacterized protein LOC129748911 [Uranotaenia lowii]XP_055599689.1 uncharacterized protein LOC129748911 [Uranotaenia lowii]